jgi:hypothetical protein
MWKLFLSDLDLELYTEDPGGVGKWCAVYLKRKWACLWHEK